MVSPDSARSPLLRSRRFWIGLSGFVLTLGFYISTGHIFIGVSHSKRISKISEHGASMKLEQTIAITEGRI